MARALSCSLRRLVIGGAWSLAGAGLLAGCMWPLPPGDAAYDLPTGFGSMSLRTQVESVRERRFRNIVPQKLDYSCGAAALATLLKFHYDEPIEEADVVLEMLKIGDVERIQREGFSLLDLKHYADRRGFETKGFRIKPEVLERLAIPSITLINTRGYLHFVVLKGARDGIVYLADPALGTREMGFDEFVEDWEGIVFFVAAERDGTSPSPLEMLVADRTAPVHLVRELDVFALREIRFSLREF
ncbi:C39 family peptidase [Myxococcota bacterium]|nr:C39 family peptidase [Myxococcota bacterium]MCZ7620253.1 C39 family peptidase [Myxococcota bacterium]